jgi:ribose transport system substrate-binding protein
VDGIAISPISEESLVPIVRKAIARGIAVICIDSDAPATGRALYMGTFNREAGLAAGRALIAALPDGGKVAAFVGSMASANAQERWGGARAACDQTAIEFVGTPQQDKGLADKAQDNVAAMLQRNPDLAGILAIWSYNGPAAARAVEAAGRAGKVKIIAFDAEPQTLDFIERGLIEATVVQRPFVWGYEGVRLLHRIKTEGREAVVASLPEKTGPGGAGIDAGQPHRDRIDTGIEVLRKEGLPAYRASLRKMGL